MDKAFRDKPNLRSTESKEEIGRKFYLFSWIKNTLLYDNWESFNNYLYNYIDDYIIFVKRQGKTKDLREQTNYYLFSALFAFANYPIYRLYFEFSKKALDRRSLYYLKPTLSQMHRDIRKSSGYYAGFSGFLFGYMISFSSFQFDKYFNPQRGIYLFAFYHLLSLSIAYPYFLNSNYKMLNSPKFISFKRHPFKYMQLIFNKQFYLGYLDWFAMNCLIMIPFYNLKAYKYESYRICRVSAHMFESGENYLKEIEKNLIKSSHPRQSGKFLFNFYPTVMNIYCVFQVYLFMCFYDRARQFIDFFRKDDSTRYLETIEKEFPRNRNNNIYQEVFRDYFGQFKYKIIKPEKPKK